MRVSRNEIANFFIDEINTWFDKYIKHNRELNRFNFHLNPPGRQHLFHLLHNKIGLDEEGFKELAICEGGNGCFRRGKKIPSSVLGAFSSKKGFMLDKNLNFICHVHHQNIFFGKEEIVELVYGVKEIHWTQKNNPKLNKKNQQIEKRLARKCHGIHPHCSICGQCHRNARTHDRGH